MTLNYKLFGGMITQYTASVDKKWEGLHSDADGSIVALKQEDHGLEPGMEFLHGALAYSPCTFSQSPKTRRLTGLSELSIGVLGCFSCDNLIQGVPYLLTNECW